MDGNTSLSLWAIVYLVDLVDLQVLSYNSFIAFLFVLFFRALEKMLYFFSFFDPFYTRSDLSPLCFFQCTVYLDF
jgi:hypothetical protein